MKKILFILLIILCQLGAFASIYSEKTYNIPKSFEEMSAKPYLLNGAENENTQTLLKVMNTNNEIFIGVNCFDYSIGRLDKSLPKEENPYYDKDRVDILISKKDYTNYYAHFIISPGGIVYDSYGKNKDFNNKYDLVPKVNSTGWEFVLVVDRKSLTNNQFINDDWLIKVIRRSNRDTIKLQSLTENIYDWTELYFNSDEDAYKALEQKLPFRIKEYENEAYPQSMKSRFAESVSEINKLKENKNRENLNKIKYILDYNQGTIYNFIGAGQQKDILKLKEPLPFVFSFVDCNSKYRTYHNKFINKLSYNVAATKGSKVSFGVILSAYEDVDKVTMSYEGDMAKNVKLGYVDKIGNYLDPIVMFNSNTLNLTKIECGETVILYVEFTNIEEGNNKGDILVKYNDTTVKLPIKITGSNIETKKIDKVIALCSLDKDFYKNVCNNDYINYLNSVSKICKYLVQNNIYSISLNLENVCINDNSINTRDFDLLLKTVYSTEIKNIYIEPLGDISLYKTRSMLNEIVSVVNNDNKKDCFFIMVNEKNKNNSDYKEFTDNVRERLNLYDFNEIMTFSLDEIPLNNRKVMWDIYDLEDKLLVPFSPVGINKDYYLSKDEFGRGNSSVIYYKSENGDFSIYSSLRFKSLCDGIDDIVVLEQFINKINEYKKNNNSSMAVKGESILQQFKDLVLSKSIENMSGNEFNTMKDKMIDYIK